MLLSLIRIGSVKRPTVVGFGPGDDVLDVRIPDTLKPRARVGAVDAAQVIDDFGLDRRRVGVVVRVVWRAPVLSGDGEPAPGRGRLRGRGGGPRRCPSRRLGSGSSSRHWGWGDGRCRRRRCRLLGFGCRGWCCGSGGLWCRRGHLRRPWSCCPCWFTGRVHGLVICRRRRLSGCEAVVGATTAVGAGSEQATSVSRTNRIAGSSGFAMLGFLHSRWCPDRYFTAWRLFSPCE